MNQTTQQIGTNSRRKIYDFLVEFITEHGYAPSVREICTGTGLNSTSTVYHHLSVLEDMGKIHMQENKTRAISLVGYEFRKADK